jgi:glycosyltransferase involved in cell wall biosynthesis
MNRKLVDVVIPTRDRGQLLPRMIEPLLADPVVDRVIVVDDAAGRDGRVEALTPSERVEVIATGGIGPALARQAGADRARAEIVLFLDDDVVPGPGLAAAHARHHERADRLLVCGYTPVVAPAGQTLSGEAEVYGRIYEERCAHYEADPHVVLSHLWGGNFSLRREHALRIGLASDRFRETSHEDRDFGLRCLEAGLEAIFDRALWAGHEYQRGWRETARESFRRGYSVALLHELHADAIGPFDERQFERTLPRPLAAIVHASARSPAGRLAIGGLYALRWLSARLRLRKLELDSVRLLRRIEAQRGAFKALEQLRRHVPSRDG